MKMKPTTILISSVAALGAFSLMGLRGQSPTPVSPDSAVKVEIPLGRDCIVTLDPRTSHAELPSAKKQVAGFDGDGTARGQLIKLSGEWCVLKDGKSENWIPTEKILMLRHME